MPIIDSNEYFPSKATKENCEIISEDFLNGIDVDGDQKYTHLCHWFSSGITANAESYLKSLITVEDDLTTTDKYEGGYFSATNEE